MSELIQQLLMNPQSFEENKYLGYRLLNEFLVSKDSEALRSLLESEDSRIYLLGISIASEMDEKICSSLTDIIVSSFEKDIPPTYLQYLFSALFKATYSHNFDLFRLVIRQLKATDYAIKSSAMHLLVHANRFQIQKSVDKLSLQGETEFRDLLLLHPESHFLKSKISSLLENENSVAQLIGATLLLKNYSDYSELLSLCLTSGNADLRRFGEEIDYLKKDLD